jgi:hypothetical protein
MRQLARSVVLSATLLAIAGCATIGPPPTPATGRMWAYFSDSDITLGPRAIIYTRSRVSCEMERRRQIENPPACVEIVVGPGTDYYALALPIELDAALPDGAIGSTERRRCEQQQATYIRTYRLVGDCQPIGVKRVP